MLGSIVSLLLFLSVSRATGMDHNYSYLMITGAFTIMLFLFLAGLGALHVFRIPVKMSKFFVAAFLALTTWLFLTIDQMLVSKVLDALVVTTTEQPAIYGITIVVVGFLTLVAAVYIAVTCTFGLFVSNFEK